MSRIEIYDKHSGAILFKKDKEGKDLDKAISKIEELELRIEELEKRIEQLTR